MNPNANPSPDVTPEDSRLLYIFIGVSVAAHILVVAVSALNLFPKAPIQFDEIAMDTELLTEAELGSAPKTVIPKAEKAQEVLVPDNQLPQLTKTYTVEEKLKEEEGIIEEPKPKIEEGKKVEKAVEDGQTSKPEVTTKLKKSEALERLVRDKLKDKTKPNNRKLQAEDNSDLAQIRDALATPGSATNTGGIAGLNENNRYRGYLTGVIRRNYAMPATFQMQKADIRAVLAITISIRGELMQVEIQDESGDSVFDDYCVRAVNKSSPFNPPPEHLAGEVILIECKP